MKKGFAKKLFCILIVFALVFTMVGCGNNDSANNDDEKGASGENGASGKKLVVGVQSSIISVPTMRKERATSDWD